MRHSRLLAILLLLFAAMLSGCSTGNPPSPQVSREASGPGQVAGEDLSRDSARAVLAVHFLDVGQADAILVCFPRGKTMLIDAGSNDDGPAVVAYLKRQGIKKIDLLIGTHPHEDHIGGLDDVIEEFPIGKFYMPRVTNTTRTFEDVLLAARARGVKTTAAVAGLRLLEDRNLEVVLAAPCRSGYEELNDYSVVTRVTYRNTSFLFTGDAGAESEREMLASGADLKADVLKVGHHGSHDSSTDAFLKKVAPRFAVISVGANNDYGHPHPETIAKLSASGAQVYRTDRDGTLVFTSDGEGITLRETSSSARPGVRSPTAPVIPAPGGQDGYIGNLKSKKFHRPTCSSLPAPHNRVNFKTRDEALRANYLPCRNCKP